MKTLYARGESFMVTNISEYLENTAARFPDKIAVEDSQGKQISYKQLRRDARVMADKLIKRGLFRQPLMLFLEKDIYSVTSMYAGIYTGNCYTPVDIKMPAARIEKIMETLKPAVIITDREHYEGIAPIAGDVPALLMEELLEGEEDTALVEKRRTEVIDTDLQYIFFTSGSTGTPKGVMLPQRAVIDFLEAAVLHLKSDESECVASQAPFYFDLSVLDIFMTHSVGGTLFITPPELFKFPIKLLEYLAEKKITLIYWVPSALVLVANLRALRVVKLPDLKKVTFCGEVMPVKQLNVWRKHLPEARYINFYGPTETTSASTFYEVNREFEDTDSLPIGIPMKNTRVILLKDDGSVAGEGEQGELCIAGSSLAAGYMGDVERTAAVFTTIMNGAFPERIYHTGDIVKYDEYGDLLYLSRKDFQIKHMGHRIELGEIETALMSLDTVIECVCLYDEAKHRIVAFVSSKSSAEELTGSLKELVPEYMLPGRYEISENLPHNMNGKLDRALLKTML